MENTYKPISREYYSTLQTMVQEQEYLRVQYYTDINEFISTRALLKGIVKKDDVEYLQFANGEAVRLDRLVRVGSHAAPGYDEGYFKCDL